MFKKAEKKSAFLRIALAGPAGSGKTYSALRLAKGIGGKIAVLDTEKGSASLYSDKFEFDVVEVSAPFTPFKYIEVIEAAEKAGYSVLVIDSLSHVWEGEGGVLDKKGELDEQPGSNHWTNWRKPKAAHQKLKEALLQSNLHVITTMRSKQAYTQTENDGKKKIQKLGMEPIAEPGIEYEFTTFFDVAMNHKATSSKDRTTLFAEDRILQITEETGKEFINWLGSAPIPQAKPAPKETAPTQAAKTTGHREVTGRTFWPFPYPSGLKDQPLENFTGAQVEAAKDSLLKWKSGKSTKVPYPKDGDLFLEYLESALEPSAEFSDWQKDDFDTPPKEVRQ